MLLFALWYGALMQCYGMWKKFFFTFERMWYKLTSKSICEETDEKFYWMEFPIATCVYKCFFSYIYSYNILLWRVKLNNFVISLSIVNEMDIYEFFPKELYYEENECYIIPDWLLINSGQL